MNNDHLTYHVGYLMDFRRDDPVFKDIIEATDYAARLSHLSLSNKEKIIGVWTGQANGSELLRIVYEGEVFFK